MKTSEKWGSMKLRMSVFLLIPETTYRPGARFGPQAVRQISALYDGFSVDGAVDIQEELDLS